MQHRVNDGGRSKYFKDDCVGDCVVRALAIATDQDYLEVHKYVQDTLGILPEDGVFTNVLHDLLRNKLGFSWRHTMYSPRVRCDEKGIVALPSDVKIILNLPLHVSAYVNGYILDTYDPRVDNEMIYGYWFNPKE